MMVRVATPPARPRMQSSVSIPTPGDVQKPLCGRPGMPLCGRPGKSRCVDVPAKFREYAANASGEFFTPSASFDEGEICTTSRTWAPSKAPLEQPQAKG